MRVAATISALLLGLAAAGCTRQAAVTDNFSGEEKQVAQVVVDLSDDATQRKPADACDDVLSDRLRDDVAGDSSCVNEVTKAFEDADAFALDVDDVTVSGTTATAVVSSDDRGGNKVERTFKLIKQDNRWRIDSFG